MPELLSWPGYEPVGVGVGMADRVDWGLAEPSAKLNDPPLTIEQFNEMVNTDVEFVPDAGDYWQSPEETVKCKTGDCEDFCILKYALLKEAGYTDMAMVIGQDVMNAHDGKRQVHALLFVLEFSEPPDKDVMREGFDVHVRVLDNRTPLIHDAAYYHKFFTPMYAVDEHKTWFFRKV